MLKTSTRDAVAMKSRQPTYCWTMGVFHRACAAVSELIEEQREKLFTL